MAAQGGGDLARGQFQKLKSIQQRLLEPSREGELSMGMSEDFELAIEEGATLVRVGSAIFGARNYG